MLGHRKSPVGLIAVSAYAWVIASAARGQERPWVRYFDTVSENVCGLIHGGNGEFVVFASTGEMTLVRGPDVILADLFVDDVANVFFGDEPAGFIDFDVDADGNRALFWLTLTGRLVDIGAFDASPSESALSPGDISNTGCDACPQWDDPTACDDDDGDGGGTGDGVDDGGSGGGGNGSDADGAEDGSSGGGSPFASLCGAGSAFAATLSMALLVTGKARRRRSWTTSTAPSGGSPMTPRSRRSRKSARCRSRTRAPAKNRCPLIPSRSTR